MDISRIRSDRFGERVFACIARLPAVCAKFHPVIELELELELKLPLKGHEIAAREATFPTVRTNGTSNWKAIHGFKSALKGRWLDKERSTCRATVIHPAGPRVAADLSTPCPSRRFVLAI